MSNLIKVSDDVESSLKMLHEIKMFVQGQKNLEGDDKAFKETMQMLHDIEKTVSWLKMQVADDWIKQRGEIKV